jgi:hypothetical protein
VVNRTIETFDATITADLPTTADLPIAPQPRR